jgi:general secretion pathway protein K
MRPRREGGFALLLVIWVLAILAVVAAGFAASTRSETRLTRNLLDAARARALAEAGIARATDALLEADPRARWRADGTPYTMQFAGGTIRIRITDENGKVDLNLTPTEVLAGLCTELAVADDTCGALVEGVTARRRAAAPPPPPSLRFNAPPPTLNRQDAAFTTVDELRQIPAIDAATLARLRRFITVYSQNGRIDPAVAPREVLLAIPGIDPAAIDRLLATRGSTSLFAPPPTLPGAEAYLAPGQLQDATIIAEAHGPGGASATERSVIELTGQPLEPVQVLEWRQDVDAPASAAH